MPSVTPLQQMTNFGTGAGVGWVMTVAAAEIGVFAIDNGTG